jgi:transcriptional regulator with XRE-family HTH domain
MPNLQSTQRAWLRQVMEASGMSLTAIARAAGAHPSTLTTFMNKDDIKHMLSARTIKRIAEATKVPYRLDDASWFQPYAQGSSLWDIQGVARASFENIHQPMKQALSSVMADKDEIWRLQTDDIALAGYRKNDIFIVSPTIRPIAGDVVVVVRPVDNKIGGSYSALMYRPPFVIGASLLETVMTPDFVDDKRLKIIGTVAFTLRARPA